MHMVGIDEQLRGKNVWNVFPKIFGGCGQYNLQNIFNGLCLYIINKDSNWQSLYKIMVEY